MTKKKITIETSVEEVRAACVEMVTKNGRPFKAMEDSGFQKLMRPIFNALNMRMDQKMVAQLVKKSATKEIRRPSEASSEQIDLFENGFCDPTSQTVPGNQCSILSPGPIDCENPRRSRNERKPNSG